MSNMHPQILRKKSIRNTGLFKAAAVPNTGGKIGRLCSVNHSAHVTSGDERPGCSPSHGETEAGRSHELQELWHELKTAIRVTK